MLSRFDIVNLKVFAEELEKMVADPQPDLPSWQNRYTKVIESMYEILRNQLT